MKEILEQISDQPVYQVPNSTAQFDYPPVLNLEKLATYLAKQQEDIETLGKKVVALKDTVDEDYNEMMSQKGDRRVTENPDGKTIGYKGRLWRLIDDSPSSISKAQFTFEKNQDPQPFPNTHHK